MLLSNTITAPVSAFHSRTDHVEVFFGMLPSSHKIMLDNPDFDALVATLGQAYREKRPLKVGYSIDFKVQSLEFAD